MKYRVFISADAEKDLFEIYRHISTYDSPQNAEKLKAHLEKACLGLSEFPDRGHTPPELERIGVFEYQEIHYKTYRIIYQVIRRNVYVHCILDSRRDLQEMLEKRLLR